MEILFHDQRELKAKLHEFNNATKKLNHNPTRGTVDLQVKQIFKTCSNPYQNHLEEDKAGHKMKEVFVDLITARKYARTKKVIDVLSDLQPKVWVQILWGLLKPILKWSLYAFFIIFCVLIALNLAR